jgi:Ca-activated chloride channel family protein
VAIDQRIRNKGGKQETVTQPLPLPEGVSDYAVGGTGGGGGLGYGGGKSMMTGAACCRTVVGSGDMAKLPAKELGKLDGTAETDSSSQAITGTVKLGSLAVKGGLTEQIVRKEIESVLDSIRTSYDDALASDAGLKGKLVLKFIIQPDGSIGKFTVVTNELNSDLEQEVRTLIERLHFTNLSGGIVTVTVPLIFER